MMQPKLNSTYNIARDGGPKRIAETIPTVPGMKRQTTGDGELGYHHGVTVDDAPNVSLKSHEQKIPLHPATPKRIADKVHPIANDPNVILQDAANLGRKA